MRGMGTIKGPPHLAEFYLARTPGVSADGLSLDRTVGHIVGRCLPVRRDPVYSGFGYIETFYWVCPPDCPVDARGYE